MAGGGVIRVAPDGLGFVDEGGNPFVPWGLNYDRSFDQGIDVVLEDLLLRRPSKLDRDFRRAGDLGANAIRIFPMLSHYVPALGQVAVEKVGRQVQAARNIRIAERRSHAQAASGQD